LGFFLLSPAIPERYRFPLFPRTLFGVDTVFDDRTAHTSGDRKIQENVIQLGQSIAEHLPIVFYTLRYLKSQSRQTVQTAATLFSAPGFTRKASQVDAKI
jgi:hypothetical protein